MCIRDSHYEDVSRHLSLKGVAEPPPLRNLVLVLVGSVHRGMLEAVRYAQSLSTSEGTVRAIHIETESAVSYTHLRAHATVLDLVCRLPL